MTGLIGFASGYAAMKECDTLLLLGTDFPYRQFYPEKARIAQVDIRAESLGNRCRLDLGVLGDVGATVAALLPRLKPKTDRTLPRRRAGALPRRRAPTSTSSPRAGRASGQDPSAISVAGWSASSRPTMPIFTCDVGTPTVWAARYLKMNGKRRLIGSFNHGSMANAMLQAIGAQAALSRPPGDLDVGRRRLHHDDGRLHHASPSWACR